MTNPAVELLAIFDRWRGGTTATPDRGIDATPDGIAEHIRAMKLIWDIELALASLEQRSMSVEVFREASTSWAKNVLAYPYGWDKTGGESETLYTAGRVDMLRALGTLLDGMPVQVNEGQASNLAGWLDEITGLLATDDSIDDALRAYVYKIVAEVRRVLGEYAATGKFDGETALTNLWVSLLAAEGQTKTKKGQWKKFAQDIKAPIAAGILINLPQLAIEAIKLTAGG